jgi:uncharacterized protein
MSPPTKMIFVNLPVRNLAKSKAFYEKLGFVNNPQFSDDTAACMVWSETIHVMLLTHAKWSTFTRKPIPDVGHSEVMLAFTFDSKSSIQALLEAVAAHGGKADVNPVQDLGFMFSRSFEDLDGHIWEAFFMDMSQVPQA